MYSKRDTRLNIIRAQEKSRQNAGIFDNLKISWRK